MILYRTIVVSFLKNDEQSIICEDPQRDANAMKTHETLSGHPVLSNVKFEGWRSDGTRRPEISLQKKVK